MRPLRAMDLPFTLPRCVVKISWSPSTTKQIGVTCGIPFDRQMAALPRRTPCGRRQRAPAAPMLPRDRKTPVAIVTDRPGRARARAVGAGRRGPSRTRRLAAPARSAAGRAPAGPAELTADRENRLAAARAEHAQALQAAHADREAALVRLATTHAAELGALRERLGAAEQQLVQLGVADPGEDSPDAP
jgi:hypothetical protein